MPPLLPERSTAAPKNTPTDSSGFATNPGSSTLSQKGLPPIRPGANQLLSNRPVATPGGSGTLAPNRPSTPASSGFSANNIQSSGSTPNPELPINPTTQRDPFANSTGRPQLPPIRPNPGAQQSNQTNRLNQPNQPNQVTGAPTRVNPATTAGGGLSSGQIPARNANTGSTTGRQIQSTLASTPTTNRSNIARATPGERKFEGVQVPALAVQKIAPREIQVNREATFELIVKNTGRATADNVQVHDFVPEGTRLVETMPPANAGANGQITWNLGALAPGQQATIKMKIIPQRAGNIGSVAHVTFGAVASAQTVCTQPKLSIRHEAPQTVLLGQNLLMTIFVENKGNGAAENVVLQEDVPEGLEFAGGQKELEYAIGTLPPGQSRQVRLPLRAAKVGQARNVLVVHGAGNLQASDTVDIRVIAPQLSLGSDGPNRKFLNRKATHTFSLANQGSAPATNVQMVARLPRGLQFVAANNQGQYDRNNHAVVWRLAKLDAQKTGSVELTTMPVAVGQHDINVTAAADLNQRQETRQSLAVEQLSELFFDIDDTADAIEVGTGTTYRVRVVNQGQIPATNVQIQVEFANAIQPVAVQGGLRNQIRGQTVVLDPIASMQPGQEISFIVSAKAVQAGEHRTIVSVRSDDRDIAVSKEESTHVYSDR